MIERCAMDHEIYLGLMACWLGLLYMIERYPFCTGASAFEEEYGKIGRYTSAGLACDHISLLDENTSSRALGSVLTESTICGGIDYLTFV